MANIGNLYFGIGGDDKELRKILEDRKKDALALQSVLSNINLGNTNSSKQMMDALRIQERKNKLIESEARAGEAVERRAANALILEQRLNNELEKGNRIRQQTQNLDRESVANMERRRVAAENENGRRNRVNNSQVDRIDQDTANRNILAQQRLQTELQRTEAARRRATLVGVQGEQSYMNAIGMTNRTLFNQKVLLSQLSTQLGAAFSIYQIGAFVKELAMVSGEFEKQRISLKAMLGDEEAAKKIFGQIKDLAVYSPFNFKELTGYAKQLSAYSIPANELFDTMKRLADVSAGLGVDMNRLTLAYGQIKAAQVLKGTEMRQLAESGLPIVEKLIQKYKELGEVNVTAADIYDKVSKRQVSFEMVKEIFQDLTNEGGMFFNMQELQATSLAGKISNLRDAYDIMLDSIGSANSGLLKGSVDVLLHVMDNWERYWDLIKGIIITYGFYRASIIAVNIAKAANVTINELVIATAGLVNRQQAAQILLTDRLTASWGRLGAAMKANMFVLVVTAIAAVAYALKSAYDEAHRLENALTEIMGKAKGDADASAASLEILLNRLQRANQYSKEYKDIIAEINAKYGEFLPNLLKESETYDQIREKLQGVTAAIYEKAKAQAYSQSVEKIESELSDKISKSYDSAIKSLTNTPIAGYDQYTLSKADANRAVSSMFAAIRNSPELYKQQKEVEKLISETMMKAYADAGVSDKVDASFGGLQNTTQLKGMITGVKEYAKAFQELEAAQEDVRMKSNASWGDMSKNYAKSVDVIEEKYAKLENKLDKESFENPVDFDLAKIENQKEKLKELIKVYNQFGQLKFASNAEEELKKLENQTLGWKKELQRELGNTLHISAESNMNDVLKDMKDKYKDIKTRMDAQKPILLKAKFDFETNSFPSPLMVSQSLMEMGKGFKADKEDIENLTKAMELFMSKLSTLYTPKEKGGSKKDEFSEKLKRNIDLMKDAKKEYEELVKLMSKKDAFHKLKFIPEYMDVKQEDITSDGYTAYLQKTIKELEDHIKKNPKSDTAKNLLNTLTKEAGGIQIGDITKMAKDEIDKIEKYLSQHKDKYNLYKQIFDITGDKGQAAQLAFGDPLAPIETYVDALKSKLKEVWKDNSYEELLGMDKSTVPEHVRDLVAKIKEATQEQDFAVKVNMSQIIADYASTEEKITAIHNKYEKERDDVRKSNEPQDKKDKAIAAYNEKEDSEINALKEELLKLTPFYRQLFADLSEISHSHLKQIADNAKEITDKILNTKNEDGKLTYGKYDNNDKLKGYYVPAENGDVTDTFIKLTEFEGMLKRISSLYKDMNKNNPFKSLMRDPKDYKIFEGTDDEAQMSKTDIFISKLGDANAIVQELGGGLSSMFSALGNEDAADAVGFVTELASSAANIATGIASGNPVQMIQGIVGGITSIAKNHDKRLDKAIKKSQLEVKRLKSAYADLERFLSRQLGAVTEKQAKDQIKNLEAQKRELESQIRNERDKKNSDDGAILDYKNQIKELNDQIRYFYEDLAGEQFGIKIKDWAKSIADSLVDAWAKGEDAAKAFDKTVADIMKNVFKNVLQKQYVEKSMEHLRGYLFGGDGRGGILGDGVLNPYEMNGLVGELASLRGNIDQWKTSWDYLCQAAKQAGIDLEENVNSDTLSKGIQAVTEDTANLLASYINAMRSDLFLQRSYVYSILQNSYKDTNTLALMQADIMLIQMNTLRMANNSDKLVELGENTYSILHSASINGSGTKFNIN